MQLFIVRHAMSYGDIWTIHDSRGRATSSMKNRKRQAGAEYRGTQIFVVDNSALTLTDQYGTLEPQQVPGQQPLF